MPRSGQTLMYFGFAILVISVVVFFMNVQSASNDEPFGIDEKVNTLILYGIVLLGVPYFISIAWKRRERLIGGSQTKHNLVALLRKDTGPNGSPRSHERQDGQRLPLVEV